MIPIVCYYETERSDCELVVVRYFRREPRQRLQAGRLGRGDGSLVRGPVWLDRDSTIQRELYNGRRMGGSSTVLTQAAASLPIFAASSLIFFPQKLLETSKRRKNLVSQTGNCGPVTTKVVKSRRCPDSNQRTAFL